MALSCGNYSMWATVEAVGLPGLGLAPLPANTYQLALGLPKQMIICHLGLVMQIPCILVSSRDARDHSKLLRSDEFIVIG